MVSPGEVRRSLTCTLLKHVSGSGRASTNHKSFARHYQRVPTIEVHDRGYNPRTSLVHRLTRGIATNRTTTSKKTFTPSIEQQAIVKLCRTQNVVVSARPGAGKTATAEAIVAANPGRPIAIITYSKRLQLDTARRLETYPGNDVLTFHGVAGQLFSTIVPNDSILSSLRRKGAVPAWTGKPYEIVILDELQDCTDDLFWLICAFISAVTDAACGRAPQIVVLGDERQAIYGFKKADSRYLSLSSSAMATLSHYMWTHVALSKSFRLSHENSAFVNNVFLGGEQYIIGSHSGPKPLYLHGNVFDPVSFTRHLLPLIHQYGPERTAILAPSVDRNRPLALLTNYLSEVHGIPIAEPISDEVQLEDRVLQGKICVSTYHQFKGNERDLVIVYGVDASYFKFVARDLPDDTCPNTTFVALTRACKHLVIVHHNQNSIMSFVDVAELYKTTNFVNLNYHRKMLESNPPGRPLQLGLLLSKTVSASELPRHVPDEIIDDICARHLQINQTQPSLPIAQHINAPAIVISDPTRGHYEAVSDLNGLAVVAAYEYALLGTLTTLERPKASLLGFPSNTNAQAIWLCREACEYNAQVSGYKARKVQMKGHRFDWLGSYLDAARDRLEAQFPETAVVDFEVQLKEKNFRVANPLGGEDQITDLYGRADIVQFEGALHTSAAKLKRRKAKRSLGNINSDGVSIWEIKFVTQLSHHHVIQACVYAYLWTKKHKPDILPQIILFNVRDGEKWEVVPRDGVASLRVVVEEMLIAKYSTKDTLTTDEFLKKCADTKAEVEESYGRLDRGSHCVDM
ncbi:P-loop containing nucleoside triphosphate hydrolase protein [Cucurbitaria berberidis CBS 394.84]|uniref:P-loop containing nucleoside triphosphate hydrolase protein n=1 Tax=Cucurbitaria berberidis CBS 394.84 TaxID=1168544 RepID=A0A9P4GPM0_9PLEO|nr:P-loop containing nucleoside triphosphate hydrolase protein [Cucurbitaria berberidis CBS 394.84]KAF1850353.1 P-loop containing nucleoside triphosphate hydrolase protein [Cucurbitaria berberidis CBS 394.84]